MNKLEITSLNDSTKKYLEEPFEKTYLDLNVYIDNIILPKKDLIDLGKKDIVKGWLSDFKYGTYVFMLNDFNEHYEHEEIDILIRISKDKSPFSFNDSYSKIEIDNEDFIDLLWDNEDWKIVEYTIREIKWLEI